MCLSLSFPATPLFSFFFGGGGVGIGRVLGLCEAVRNEIKWVQIDMRMRSKIKKRKTYKDIIIYR